MGDLPIFVAHDSADCWARPDLYFLDDDFQPTVVAGVPPDDLGPLGQRWGNPLYRWDRMAAEGYAWWTARVRRALDASRCDSALTTSAALPATTRSPRAARTRRQAAGCQGPGKATVRRHRRSTGQAAHRRRRPRLHHTRRERTARRLRLPRHEDPAVRFRRRRHARIPAAQLPPQRHRLHRHARQRHGARLVGPRRAAERAFAGSYLACNDHDIHWAMIRAACNSVANVAIVPAAGRAGPRQRTPHEHARHRAANWTWRFAWAESAARPRACSG